MSYADLLKDPRWQKKRLEVLELRGWKCERCDDKNTELHVHHKRYLKGKMPWEYDDSDLCVLCSHHHEAWHRSMDNLMQDIVLMDLPAFDSVVAYAMTMASMRSDYFSRSRIRDSHIGGILDCIGMRGEAGRQFVKDRIDAEGLLDVPKLIADSQGEKSFKAMEVEEVVAGIVAKIRSLIVGQ